MQAAQVRLWFENLNPTCHTVQPKIKRIKNQQPRRKGRFLERYNLPRLNQKYKLWTEIETVILKCPRNKSLRPDSFTGKFCQTFRGHTYPSETLPENCRGRNTAKLILWGHHRIPKPDKNTIKKKARIKTLDSWLVTSSMPGRIRHPDSIGRGLGSSAEPPRPHPKLQVSLTRFSLFQWLMTGTP